MCRLYGFLANARTQVECGLTQAQNSLLAQSRGDMRGLSHADGWGIGFFEEGVPWVQRRASPAYEDLRFCAVAAQVAARVMLSHVRKSTMGSVGRENTHPFVYGRWLFAHNGTLEGFPALEHRIYAETDVRFRDARLGATDSEAIFLWLLTRLEDAGVRLETRGADVDLLRSVVAKSVRELAERSSATFAAEPARLNFVLTNGEVLVASRWHRSLYVQERSAVDPCDRCGGLHVQPDDAIGYRAVAVASEPISGDAWRKVPDEHVLSANAEQELRIQSIEAALAPHTLVLQ